MKNYLDNLAKCLVVLVLFIAICSSKANSAEPLVFVPPLPQNEEQLEALLEVFTETETVYAYQILELTKMSIVLSTQLQIITGGDEVIANMPTLDQISSLEEEYLKKVWENARNLYEDVKRNQVKKVDQINRENLKEIEKSYNQIQALQDSVFWLGLEIADYASLRSQLDSATKYIEMLKINCNEIINNNKIAISSFKGLNRMLSFSVAGNKFFPGNSQVSTEFAPSLALNIYSYSFLGYGKYLDLWLDYTEPQMKIKTDNNPEEEFKNRCISFGLNFQIDKVLSAGDIDFSLKIGAGLFWADGHIPNTNAKKSYWSGEKIKFELNTSKINKNFPFELFTAVNLNIPAKDYIIYSNYENIKYGNKLFTDISLGLRFSLWNN